MKNSKRILSSLLAFSMVLSSVSLTPLKAYAEDTAEATALEEEYIDSNAVLSLDTEKVVTQDSNIEYYYFTPETDGEYVFYSEGDYDTIGRLYDSDDSCLANNDDGGEGNNFKLYYSLTGGETYLINAKPYYSEETYSFSLYVSKVSEPTGVSIIDDYSEELSAVSVYIGEYIYLFADILPENASKACTWTSDNESVAEIFYTGNAGTPYAYIEALAEGTATITVKTANGLTDTCTVTVSKRPEATSVEIVDDCGESLDELTLYIDQYDYISAVLTPEESVNELTWSSSNEEIVTVSSYGRISPVAVGTATITVTTDNGCTDTCEVTIAERPAISEITVMDSNGFDCDKLTLYTGQTKWVDVITAPEDAVSSYTWTTTDENVAVVNYDNINAVGAGTATLTVTAASGVTDTIVVTVKDRPAVSEVKITSNNGYDCDSLDLYVDEYFYLGATVSPKDAISDLEWTTSNESVATVSYGTVTAVGTGTATITVTDATGVSDTCVVTVKALPEISEINIVDNGNHLENLPLYVGDSKRLYTDIAPYNAVYDYEWSTSDETVAAVNNYGEVTAVAAGTATITVTAASGVKDTCVVTVYPVPALTGIDASDVVLYAGETDYISIDTTPYIATDEFTYSSDNEAVVTVDENGYVEAVSVGTAKITVTSAGGIADTCTVTVIKRPDVAKVSITDYDGFDVDYLNLFVNEYYNNLNALITPYDAVSEYTWTSSDETIAEIDECGAVYAKKTGTVTITLTAGNLTDTCNVNVIARPAATGVNILDTDYNDCEELYLYVGEEYRYLNAEILPEEAYEDIKSWTSSDTSVVTVSYGRLEAKKSGTATITVTSESGLTDTCTVTVSEIPEASSIRIIDNDYSGSYEDLEEITVYNGEYIEIEALIVPRNADVTWAISDMSVIDGNSSWTWSDDFGNGGNVLQVKAINVGTATVTVATDNGLTDTIEVTVVERPEAEKVIITDSDGAEYKELSLQLGDTQRLYAEVLPENALQNVLWTTSDRSVVIIDYSHNNYCYIDAVGVGTATITAKTENGVKATCVVTVTDCPEITGISIVDNWYDDIEKISGYVGDYDWLYTSIIPDNSNDEYFWETSDIAVATISSDGRVNYVGVGEATITVKTANGLSDSIKVTVTEAPAATELYIYSDEYEILPRQEIGFDYGFSPYGSDESVVWSSSDNSVATVSKDGVVTGISAGTATITATTASGLTATCTVTVKSANVLTTETPVSVELEENEIEYITFTPEESGEYCIYTSNRDEYQSPYLELINVQGAWQENGDGELDYYFEEGITYTICVFSEDAMSFEVLTVKYVDAESIVVTPDSITAAEGTTFWNHYAYFTPEFSFGEDITWTSSDTDVVYERWDGLYFVGEGTATITATSENGLADTMTVTVKPATEIKLDETMSASLNEGEFSTSFKFVAEEAGAYKVDIDNDFSCGISFRNALLYDIDSDMREDGCYQIELEKGDICYIAVYDEYEEYGDFTVSVEKLVPIESISMDIGTEYSNYKFTEFYIGYEVAPENVIEEDIRWTSSDSSIVKINQSGRVEFIKAGTATVTATTESGVTTSCVITVKDFPTIKVDETKNVTISDDAPISYFYFMPEEDGYYVFCSTNTVKDTYGYIYDSDMNRLAYDDDSGTGRNFKAGYLMEGGVTYILAAKIYSETNASFDVLVEKSTYITGLEIISNPDKTEYIAGYENDYISYSGLKLKVTWSDGSVTEWEYDDSWMVDVIKLSLDTSELNETGKVVISSGDASVDLQFSIIENPVDYIELVSGTNRTYIENYNGEYEYNTDGAFFYYYTSTPSDAVIKIVYKDGTSETANVGSYINGYKVNWNSEQYLAPWVLGTENQSTIEYLGAEVNLPITVVKNTVKSIEVVSGKITCYENADGHYNTYYDGETGNYVEYFYYDYLIPDEITIKITYTDDTTKTVGVNDEVDGVEFEVDSNQEEAPWTLGDDNAAIVSYLGVTAEIPVSIVENSVESLVINTAPTREYVFGDMSWGYMNGGEYCLTPSDLTGLSFTLNYTDGTSKTFTDSDIEDGMIDGYYISCNNIYAAEPGEYTGKFSYMGKADEYDITIKESTVESIAITKLPSMKYYDYYDPNFIGAEFTITYTDGSTKVVAITEENIEVEFDNEYEYYITVDVDGYFLTISELYMDDEPIYEASYLGAGCYITGFEYEEMPEIDEIELDNVTENGDGMVVDVTYEDGTTETITIDPLDWDDDYNVGASNTSRGLLRYEIYPAYDEEDDDELVGYDVYILGEEIYVEAATVLYGDVNGDGRVNAIDVLLIRKHMAGGWGVTIDQKAADVNCDGRINAIDVLMLRKSIAGGWGVVLGPQE